MPKIKCKITGTTPLGGKRVGEEFFIDVDDDGTPLDFFWRRRFDEGVHQKGFVEVMSSGSEEPPPAKSSNPTPPTTPTPTKSSKS